MPQRSRSELFVLAVLTGIIVIYCAGVVVSLLWSAGSCMAAERPCEAVQFIAFLDRAMMWPVRALNYLRGQA